MESLTERQPVDRDALDNLLRRITAAAEATGWHDDGGGFLSYIAYDTADLVTAGNLERCLQKKGSPVRAGRYAAQPFVGNFTTEQADAIGADSSDRMFANFAMNIGFADPDIADRYLTPGGLQATRQLLSQPGIVGFAAAGEAWGFKTMTPLVRELVKSGMDMGDIKGSTEARFVLFCDLNGHRSQARKWRDETDVEIKHGVRRCDPVVVGLRVLADVAAGTTMPTTDEQFTARYHDTCAEPDEEH